MKYGYGRSVNSNTFRGSCMFILHLDHKKSTHFLYSKPRNISEKVKTCLAQRCSEGLTLYGAKELLPRSISEAVCY